MRLQLDRPDGRDRRAAFVVVFHRRFVHDELVIHGDRDCLAAHFDADLVPFPNRLVGDDERPLAVLFIFVIPQRAGPFVRAIFLFFSFLGSQIWTWG